VIPAYLLKARPAPLSAGRSIYVSQDELHQFVANAVAKYGVDAFIGPKLRAHSLLVKRPTFADENEVRLIYVEQRALSGISESAPNRLSEATGDRAVAIAPPYYGQQTEYQQRGRCGLRHGRTRHLDN
jgi:hypothetical protein